MNRLRYKLKLFLRFGFKYKRYQVAWDKVYEAEDVRNWHRLYRLQRGLPVFQRSGEYEEYYDPFFLKRALNMMVIQDFADLKPFPRNAGSTIRFFKP